MYKFIEADRNILQNVRDQLQRDALPQRVNLNGEDTLVHPHQANRGSALVHTVNQGGLV